MSGVVQIARSVSRALESGKAVVALETAVLTHGLPRKPIGDLAPSSVPDWPAQLPAHRAAMEAMMIAIEREGAVPAVVGVIDGVLHVGLDREAVAFLAGAPAPRKASSADLPVLLSKGVHAGTTVSGTLVACGIAGIRYFATGGIGGVHRGWTKRPDVSADLSELARTPTAVICAGAKSILDVPATVEWLQSLGVPVAGFRCRSFPRFHGAGREDLVVSTSFDDAAEAARFCRCTWHDLRRRTGLLFVQDPPAADAIDARDLDGIIDRACGTAEERGIHGDALTPFLLASLAEATEGRTLRANAALLVSNALLAAKIALADAPSA